MRMVLLAMLGTLLVSLLAVGMGGSTSASALTDRPIGPTAVDLVQVGEDLRASWTPPSDELAAQVSGYAVTLWQRHWGGGVGWAVHEDRRLEREIELPADQFSVDLSGVAWWDETTVFVRTMYVDEDVENGSDGRYGTDSNRVQLMSTVRLLDTSPVVAVDRRSTDDGEGKVVVRREFEFDRPMPVDTFIDAAIVSQSVQWPPIRPIEDDYRVEAGETRGWIKVTYPTDDWKRFDPSSVEIGLSVHVIRFLDDELFSGRPSGEVYIDPSTFTVSLTDEDVGTPPWASAPDAVEVVAGEIARVPVRLSRPAPRRASITYRTVDRTAHAGSHYRSRSGSLTVKTGRRTAWVEVPTIRASKGSRPRTFDVVLEDGRNANVSKRHNRAHVRVSR